MLSLASPGAVRTHAAVAMLSASMLMLELLKTITLSFALYNQIAFMVVSLALLGLGAGGSLATWLSRYPALDPAERLFEIALTFGVSIAAAETLTARSQGLVPLIFTSTIPFLFAGLFLAAVLMSAPARLHSLYFANLLGSALGCIGLLGLIDWRGQAGTVVLACAGLAFLGAAALSRSRVRTAAAFACMAACAALLPRQDALFPYRPNPAKHYGLALADTRVHSTVDWSRWGFLGRLDAVSPGPGFENVPYDVSTYITRKGCDFRYLFANGDNWSYTVRCPPYHAVLDTYARRVAHVVPYAAMPPHPDVLDIGVGGGIDVYLALQHDAHAVVGVEINPLMIEAAGERYRDFFGDPYHDPRVEIRELDGRTFVETTDRSFDLVTLSGVDTGAGLAAGANVLSESYLYTEEAFDAYFRVLRDDGVIYVYRPYDQLLRAVTTAIAALRRRGEPRPERHIVLFLQETPTLTWAGAVIARKPLDAPTVGDLVAALRPGHYPLEYATGWPAHSRPETTALFDRVARDDETSFYDAIAFDTRPVSDDQPYYYQQDRSLLTSFAGKLLLRILGWVTLGAIALVVMPILPTSRRRLTAPTRIVPAMLYFCAVGAGFMFIEIGLIQKLALFLGHPAYSVAVTLPTMLFFSGLGSLSSSRFFPEGQRPRALPFAIVAACAVGYAFLLQPLLGHVGARSLVLRSAMAVLLLAPASFFQGMPFPMMLRRIGERSPTLVPWAYAVNSVASVAASVLVVLVAMGAGFRVVLLVGAACYVLALVLAVRPLRIDRDLPAS